MATVTELANFVTRCASLNTSDTAEQALVLTWLNNEYIKACAVGGIKTYDASVTPATGSDVILKAAYVPATTVSQGVAGVRQVFLAAGAGNAVGRELERVSVEEILRLRSEMVTTTYDGPVAYSVRGTGDIELYPSTAAGNVVVIEMELLPLVLVASSPTTSQEATPSSLPPQFHYDILANGAIAHALTYRGLGDRGSYFRQLADAGLGELRAWLSEQGGIMGPVVKVKRRRGLGGQPDTRW